MTSSLPFLNFHAGGQVPAWDKSCSTLRHTARRHATLRSASRRIAALRCAPLRSSWHRNVPVISPTAWAARSRTPKGAGGPVAGIGGCREPASNSPAPARLEQRQNFRWPCVGACLLAGHFRAILLERLYQHPAQCAGWRLELQNFSHRSITPSVTSTRHGLESVMEWFACLKKFVAGMQK